MNHQGGHSLTASNLYLQNSDGHVILIISPFAQWSFSAHYTKGRSECAGNQFVVVYMQL